MSGARAIMALSALGGGEAAPAIALCDQKGCSEPATFAYTWEWGESGKCCGTHQFTLNQTAGNISRAIQFQPLNAGIAPPMERSERIQLIAKAMTLEAELAEGKQRGLELYNQNVHLTAQVQSLTMRERELTVQVNSALADLVKAGEELTQRRAEAANLSDELGRLRVLVDRPPQDVEQLRAELRATKVELGARTAELNELLEGATAPGAERTTVGLGPDDPKV